jgi:hypothetical protein
MSRRTIKTAALCFTTALLAGAAHATPLSAPRPFVQAEQSRVEIAYRGYPSRSFTNQGQASRAYGYDANSRPYAHQDDEMQALQYMFPQTYGWPRGTRNQF